MTATAHHVIIGNGIAGTRAAAVLRERDPRCRITIVSAGVLLCYNRYELPDVFRGRHDWVDYLVDPPEYYEEKAITVRRNTVVNEVDTARRKLSLGHRELLSYDQLLVATGGGGYIPERLLDSRRLMHDFFSFQSAMAVYEALPENGRVIMLGGDVLGLDLARKLVDIGYRVTLVAGERTFWPHDVSVDDRPRFVQGLRTMGIEVIEGIQVDRVEEGAPGMPARRVVFDDGDELHGDVVMPFFGLVPAVDFMSSAGIDIERGILVDPKLQTTRDDIWAAGDVCQIWSPELNNYRFYYGWRNVKQMGEVAARNMAGDKVQFASTLDERLSINDDGTLFSPFWEYGSDQE